MPAAVHLCWHPALARVLLSASLWACLLCCCLLQLVVFDRCGHMPQEECPEQFVEVMQRFVDSLDA